MNRPSVERRAKSGEGTRASLPVRLAFSFFALCSALFAARAGWTPGAWPACEHVGGREFSPGVLFKQIWARDIYRALEERCYAVSTNGSTNVWAALLPDWWTEAGVTNRVVRHDGTSVDSTDSPAATARFVEAAKTLTALLAPSFLNPSLADPAGFPSAWHDWQEEGGARTAIPVSTNAYTAWVWDCPGTEHAQTFVLTEMGYLGTNTWNFTGSTLPEHAHLPRSLLGITPHRLLEGLCDPDTAATAPLWVFRDSAITGVCNWATFGTVTATNGAATASWPVALGCLSAGDGATTRALRLTNSGGVTATHVRVSITLDSRLELVKASTALSGDNLQWHAAPAAPALAYAAAIAPGEHADFNLTVRLRRDQGTSPHDDGIWYWSDFGWDALRSAVQNLTNQVLVIDGFAAQPLIPAWSWDAGDGDNQGNSFASSHQTYLYAGSLPGTEITAGSYADLIGTLEADWGSDYAPSQNPLYTYEVLFTAEALPAPTNDYTCAWLAEFSGTKSSPTIDRTRTWPPAGVTARVRYLCDVESYTAPDGQQTWATEELGENTFATPGTADVVIEAVVGEFELNPALYPGDPSGSAGTPQGGGVVGLGSDDVVPGASVRRGNGYRTSKSWSDPFLLVEYTWSYP